ncbi:MAG: hypothetical protein R2849_04755 [Thermomicrobiales bacterium]
MFGAPEPPRWPRLVARIVGTVGFVLVAPFALVILLGTALNLVDGSATNNPTLFDYVLMSLIGIASATLALGLLLAWWREGIGALLIFAGSALLVLATIGLSLLFIFGAVRWRSLPAVVGAPSHRRHWEREHRPAQPLDSPVVLRPEDRNILAL